MTKMSYYQKTGFEPLPDSVRTGWKYSPKILCGKMKSSSEYFVNIY